MKGGGGGGGGGIGESGGAFIRKGHAIPIVSISVSSRQGLRRRSPQQHVLQT